MLRNKMSGTIMLIFILGMDRAKLFFWQPKCQTFFWQPKPLLAVGTRELVAFILGSIFLAVKSIFGRILPKIQVGTISAKNKSCQTQSFFCFLHVHIVTHFVIGPHTPHQKHKTYNHIPQQNTSLSPPPLPHPSLPPRPATAAAGAPPLPSPQR